MNSYHIVSRSAESIVFCTARFSFLKNRIDACFMSAYTSANYKVHKIYTEMSFCTMNQAKLEKRDPRKIGYARVSTKNQNLDIQIDQLKSVGCYKIFVDKISGKEMKRSGWQALCDYMRLGDTIVVTELSRMSRSLTNLLCVAKELEKKGVEVISLKENIDTKSAMGRFFFL